MGTYIADKIAVLKNFKIKLTPDQLNHIRELKTEIAIDNFARSLIQGKLGCTL